MPIERLKRFLDDRGVRYFTVRHSPAYTAQEVAAAVHVPGRQLAKSVMVLLDGRMAMAVVPASHRVDLAALARLSGHEKAELAAEREFTHLFPGCEAGGMPPFGNLWNLPVYASTALAKDERIYFNAGTHLEVIGLAFADFRQLAEPKIIDFSRPEVSQPLPRREDY